MTAPAMVVAERPNPVINRRVGWVGLWISSIGAYFLPGYGGRVWRSVSLGRAWLVAAINLLFGMGWLLVVLVCATAWDKSQLRKSLNMGIYVEKPGRVLWKHLEAAPRQYYEAWRGLDLLDKYAWVFGAAVLAAAFLVMLFFVLLPFAARPGKNKACVKHVLRTVLLGTGFVHIAGAATAAAFLGFVAYRYQPGLENIIEPILWMFSGLVLWCFVVLVRAMGGEYRLAKDFPEAHDPTCDACGYDLVAAEMGGRCPECGRPVADSLGVHVRNATAWERRPVPWNLGVIGRQLGALIAHPRALFASMPTLTGQAAAHRWLAGAIVLIAAEAFLIMPAFSFFGLFPMDWTNQLAGGVAVGIVWAFLALMMVGIETAGIATFSRIKRTPVSLGTAAKVTAYSAVLMLPWVILGGAQILGIAWWSEHSAMHYSIRVQQVVATGSLAAAHIGGLLWFEFTVYRGIRSVQFANQ